MKLGIDQISLMNALDSVAGVSAKDCFVDGDTVVFLVPEEQMKKAIGRNGETIEGMSRKLGKKIELFEYSGQPEKFFEKAFQRAKPGKVEVREINGRKIAFVNAGPESKKIILQSMRRLRKIKEIAKRNYSIDEVRVR